MSAAAGDLAVGRASARLPDEAPVDEIDRQLIALLRENARVPVATLAKKLRVARGTVQNRLAKLEADGTVVGYTVRLRPQVEEQRIRALMSVAVEGNKAEAVLKALRGDPAVGALYSTNGRWDIVAELRSDSLEAFDRVLGRIRLIEGISSTETSLLLSTHKL
jgi:DNA-binding Lrp family transcriptional regulator